MDSTSNSLLGKNKINNHDALVINNTNDQSKSENCNELQKKIDEAIKVLIGDCGEQNDELLLWNKQVNGK